MTTFKKFKKIKSVLNEIPGIKTYKEFDILIEIGYHEELGKPLTLKQLTQLGIASQATLCRHLNRLVQEGMVKKEASADDRRSFVLRLSTTATRSFTSHFSKIIEHLGDCAVFSPKSRSRTFKKL
ncbi:MAG: MarR family transcriptional regulator [Nitrosomonadales bacterium]|nr:MarR family transcriptional regulator [Nitrosomonadales bacterium]